MRELDATEAEYELGEIDERIVLFTIMRLDRNTVPEGLFCYDIRESDNLNGRMAEIKPFILANHWGTILSKEPFPLNEFSSYIPDDWGYFGKSMSLAEFQEATKEQLASYLAPQPTSQEMTMQQ